MDEKKPFELNDESNEVSDEELEKVTGGFYYVYNEETQMYDVFKNDGTFIKSYYREDGAKFYVHTHREKLEPNL